MRGSWIDGAPIRLEATRPDVPDQGGCLRSRRMTGQISMAPASKPVEIDARWIYRRSFLLFFLVFELLVWQRLQQRPMRAPDPPS